MAGDPSHYIFEMQQLINHGNCRFESLQKFKNDNRFISLVETDFGKLRRLNRDSIVKQVVKICKQICQKLEERIDAAEVEVSTLTTKTIECEFLTVEDSRKIFRTIEIRKAELRLLADTVVKSLGRIADEIDRKTN